MPSAKTLIGVGAPALWANQVGLTVSTKAGVGTAQAGATPITTNLTIATCVSGQTAFLLPVTGIGDGPYTIANASAGADTALVFPPTSGTIQGGSANASFSVAQNKTAIFFKTTATAWVVNLSA
jgi:hypothetical protein